MKIIDARGLCCPEPVIMTKKALNENLNELRVIIDNKTSRINVERFLKVAGYQVLIEEKPNGEIHLTAQF